MSFESAPMVEELFLLWFKAWHLRGGTEQNHENFRQNILSSARDLI